MCDVCATPRRASRSLEDNLRTYGWAIQYVDGAGHRAPAYAFTVGLSCYGHPELIVFDPDPATAYLSLKPLAWAVLEGATFEEGDDLAAFFPPPDNAELLTFPDSATHLHAANALFRAPGRPPLPALQLLRPARLQLQLLHPLAGR
ncbi:DUF4262 domain-containing protein [Kribbella sandramycini]|uniref:DUF4262 domain-containing protein n=1 Tax=Kribbella sandramycini TaxID=60450 RepID=A0A7Y4KU78_9ACTN|nr:DUF4262 domain-containing protein [Kribbella sandramycini]MBB6568686.1 hypothetical protein [Kribbella sandramycini]NOL38728.1 DUF4262 domain-containing protein [Kribbella sandramycini]